jgi:ABC-type bacteriocin/lantibiotic exporter with double-glycine peptidase domain
MILLQQDKEYNCAVYALEFLLRFNGILYDIKVLEKELGTNEKDGTSHKQIIDWLKNKVTSINYGYNGFIKDLHFKLPCLVNYQLCDEDDCDGHYGVLLTISDKSVIVYNPYNGELDKMYRDDFVRKWYSERYGKRWFLKIDG